MPDKSNKEQESKDTANNKSQSKEEKVIARLKEYPGDPIFAHYADLLRKKSRNWEAFQVCIQGLTVNPDCHAGRVILARLFYDLGSVSFAVRELQIVNDALPLNEDIRSLLGRLSPGAATKTSDADEETVVAETEFDMDVIDFLS